jgi:membrane associated rhomboid family serine protease
MDSQRMFGMTPWVRRLLVANLLVYLCQQTILVDPRFQAAFGFDPLLAAARPWTFVTYMFLHGGLLHLAFNLLALFMFGPPVEERMGGHHFLTYYVLCGLGGAAFSFLLMQVRPVDHPIVGASAAIYGVMLAFAWAWPDQPIYVFPFPTPIPAKWLVTFAVGISFVLALLRMSEGVAHLAHLGGFATGFVYLKVGDWRLAQAERQVRRAAQPSVVVQSARVAGSGSNNADAARKRRAPPERDAAAAEVDRVLDKISARGIDSLTPAERRFLSDMSKRMRGKS